MEKGTFLDQHLSFVSIGKALMNAPSLWKEHLTEDFSVVNKI
jgi:hypothetical protein